MEGEEKLNDIKLDKIMIILSYSYGKVTVIMLE